jgi:glycerophosphoryl diester phosphodiesterase
MKNFFKTKPVIFSTGGGVPSLIEGTIQNFRNAVSLGADVIRTNVFITGDKKVVVASDSVYFDKALMKEGIEACTLDRLRDRHGLCGKRPDDGGGDEIVFPELARVLAAFPDQRFNFEIGTKSPELAYEFCSILHGMRATDRALVSAFSGKVLSIVRMEHPEAATSFSYFGVIGFYALFRSGLLYYPFKFNADALIFPENLGVSYMANAALVRSAQSRGISVYALDVGTEEKARRLRDAGVDGFITDDIDMAKRIMSR